MRDTSPAVEARYLAMLMSLSPQERMRRAATMYSDARKLVEESIRQQNTESDRLERRIELFRRLYACDFSEKELSAIIDHLIRPEPIKQPPASAEKAEVATLE